MGMFCCHRKGVCRNVPDHGERDYRLYYDLLDYDLLDYASLLMNGGARRCSAEAEAAAFLLSVARGGGLIPTFGTAMHGGGSLSPEDDMPGPMTAKHRIRRVRPIRLPVIGQTFQNLLAVVAFPIPAEAEL